MKKNVIEVKNLEKYFEVSGGFLSRKKATVKKVIKGLSSKYVVKLIVIGKS